MNLFNAPGGQLRPIWRFFLAVLIAYFANIVAGMFAGIFATGRYFEVIYRPLALVMVLAGFFVLSKIADDQEGNPISAMGLGLHGGWFRDFLIGCVVGFTLIAAAVTAIAVFGDLNTHVTLSSHSLMLAGIELVILLSGALLEEVMFRGYPFQRLTEAVGPVGAIAILSALFGMAHLGNPSATFWSVTNTVAIGVLFSIVYLRTRSLWMPFGIHFAWNATLGTVLGLPVSGLTSFAVIVKSKAHGPVWLTGGKYGIEGSALGTVVILIGLVAVLITLRAWGGTERLRLAAERDVPAAESIQS